MDSKYDTHQFILQKSDDKEELDNLPSLIY